DFHMGDQSPTNPKMVDRSARWVVPAAVVASLVAAIYLFWLHPAAMRNPYIAGYTFSVLLGIPLSWLCWWLLHRGVEKYVDKIADDKGAAEKMAPRVFWLPFLLGLFERSMATTLIGFSVSGGASFLATWMAIKAAGGWTEWGRGNSTPYTRA